MNSLSFSKHRTEWHVHVRFNPPCSPAFKTHQWTVSIKCNCHNIFTFSHSRITFKGYQTWSLMLPLLTISPFLPLMPLYFYPSTPPWHALQNIQDVRHKWKDSALPCPCKVSRSGWRMDAAPAGLSRLLLRTDWWHDRGDEGKLANVN